VKKERSHPPRRVPGVFGVLVRDEKAGLRVEERGQASQSPRPKDTAEPNRNIRSRSISFPRRVRPQPCRPAGRLSGRAEPTAEEWSQDEIGKTLAWTLVLLCVLPARRRRRRRKHRRPDAGRPDRPQLLALSRHAGRAILGAAASAKPAPVPRRRLDGPQFDAAAGRLDEA